MIRAYVFWRRRFYIIIELVVSLGWRGNCLRLLCVIDVFTNKLIMNTIMKRNTKIKLFAMMALFVVLTSCDEQLDNAINASKVTSIAIDFSSIEEKFVDDENVLLLPMGDELALPFTILPSEVSNVEVTLTSSDPSVISTNGQTIKALKEGETNIIAQVGNKIAEVSVKVVSDMIFTPLTFEAAFDDVTVKLNRYTRAFENVFYSCDDGKSWSKLPNEGVFLKKAGDKVAFRASNPKYYPYRFMVDINDPGNANIDETVPLCYVYGNVMSLTNEENFSTSKELVASAFTSLFREAPIDIVKGEKRLVLPALKFGRLCYHNMFRDCTALTTMPELPATTLSSECYAYMFTGCKSLKNVTPLPASKLTTGCYRHMFDKCSSLTEFPKLEAQTLADGCYSYMFNDCISLIVAPQLPETELKTSCYYAMFSGCSSLKTAPILPAKALVLGCYERMFYKCTSLASITCLAEKDFDNEYVADWLTNVSPTGTFVKSANANFWTSGDNIAAGWTIENAN